MINTVIGYSQYYIETLTAALNSIDKKALEQVFGTLFMAYHQGNNVFICGNGGSASISEHFVCDHMKGINYDTDLKPKLISLNSNVSLITALANDCGYENIFSEQLKYFKPRPEDVLVTISSSGNSPNIINALKKAKELNMHTIALVGFDGGRAKYLADTCIHINVNNYGICEDTHQNIMHMIAQFTRQKFTNKNEVTL
jgi:D-sedoheptulose 7-phosphate isomerase